MVFQSFTHLSILSYFFFKFIQVFLQLEILLTMLFLCQFDFLDLVVDHFGFFNWSFPIFSLSEQLLDERFWELFCLWVRVDRQWNFSDWYLAYFEVILKGCYLLRHACNTIRLQSELTLKWIDVARNLFTQIINAGCQSALLCKLWVNVLKQVLNLHRDFGLRITDSQVFLAKFCYAAIKAVHL